MGEDEKGSRSARREAGRAGERRSRTVAPPELLTGSSFALTAEMADRDPVSLWGRAAVGRFDGREGDLSLHGEVVTGMLGADWSRGSGARSWTAGLIASHGTGTGGWSGGHTTPDGAPGISGRVEEALTGLFAWARYGLADRLEAWGAAGYGGGALTVTPKKPGTDEDGAAIRADLDLRMRPRPTRDARGRRRRRPHPDGQDRRDGRADLLGAGGAAPTGAGSSGPGRR
ncbi:MAG: hypothetical protein OXE53_13290 [Deltaproteobacteria bacterium]|nr:hypothetical protein [Deltaproteobacteria bacterium]